MHNCGMGPEPCKLLKFIDAKVHDRYILERYKNKYLATEHEV